MPRSALIVRHVPYEGVAGFLQPLEEAGYAVDRIDVGDADFSSRCLVEPDLLIMMGGPMSVYEHHRHPWIRCQLRRLAKRLAADRPTLGVCFGAQMIATALGATVAPAARPEIGFAPLTLTPAGRQSPLRHLEGRSVLHWHGDTFALPAGAEPLASTPDCPHQAFRWGTATLALQFHAEMGLDPRIEGWIAESADGLVRAGTSAERIRADYARLGPSAVAAGRAMVTQWLAQIAHVGMAERRPIRERLDG